MTACWRINISFPYSYYMSTLYPSLALHMVCETQYFNDDQTNKFITNHCVQYLCLARQVKTLELEDRWKKPNCKINMEVVGIKNSKILHQVSKSSYVKSKDQKEQIQDSKILIKQHQSLKSSYINSEDQKEQKSRVNFNILQILM